METIILILKILLIAFGILIVVGFIAIFLRMRKVDEMFTYEERVKNIHKERTKNKHNESI